MLVTIAPNLNAFDDISLRFDNTSQCLCQPHLDAFPWEAWPRDAALTRTSKHAGKALRSQGHQLRSCHETKRFRILATLKQGNKSMYSSTSGYVHMGLRLDWGKGITGQ